MMAPTSTLRRETEPAAAAQSASVFVCVPSLAPEALGATLNNLVEALDGRGATVVTPDTTPGNLEGQGVRVITYAPSTPSQAWWVPTASDYLNAWTAAREHRPANILLLSAEAASIPVSTLRHLANSALDLTVPRYPVGPHDALVNSAIMYPLTRALFSRPVRYPLPLDVAMSARMAERLATAAQRLTAAGQGDALIWPVAEAALGALSVGDFPSERRAMPHPNADSLNALLATVAGSLFSDIEAKAAFWQRARLLTPSSQNGAANLVASSVPDPQPLDLAPMIDGFRIAYTNLRELWSLVLPPNSLLSLKKLSVAPVETFRMPDALWARTVYDFLLAYRLRTINRGHLLGALTPLYLAWVASHLRLVGGDMATAEQHVENVAAAFENDKPYLVARWRWPDRFNP
jgi:hypothetical protein